MWGGADCSRASAVEKTAAKRSGDDDGVDVESLDEQ